MNMKIEVIKVINDQFPTRIQNIYSSIFSRTASYYKDEPQITFLDKTTIKDSDWINKNNINNFPTTLFYVDDILVAELKGIVASHHIIKEIEPYIPKFKKSPN